MSLLFKDIELLYNQTFGGKPYRIEGTRQEVSQLSGSALTADYLGKEIWLPVKFVNLNESLFGVSELLLPYTVIKISAKKTIVKTPMVERKGTVKELYSVEDYNINIKGFVIDEANRIWPEQELTVLKKLWELNEAIEFDNALSNIFLDKDTRVVIESLELPEVEGGRKHMRPFNLTLESDSVFTLEV